MNRACLSSICLYAVIFGFTILGIVSGGAAWGGGLDLILLNDCLKGCAQTPGPCCAEVCRYRACIAGQTQVGTRSGLDMTDPGSGAAARAACMPHEQIIKKCVEREAARGKPSRQSEPEGRPFIDLPCCQWWLIQKDGGFRVSGHYFTPDKKRVDYTSEALAPVHLGDSTKGLFALKSGVGYHLYYLNDYDANTGEGTFIVTRLSDKVETLHRIRFAGRCYLNIAPDFSFIEVVHNTPSDRQAFNKIVLK